MLFILVLFISGYIFFLADSGSTLARFLSNVPHDENERESSFFKDERDIHDSIVKLPGRIIPKLSWSHLSPQETHRYRGYHTFEENNDVAHKHSPLQPHVSAVRSGAASTYADGAASDAPVPVSTALRQRSGPRFDRSPPRHITAAAGTTASLACRVLALGEHAVGHFTSTILVFYI